MSAVKVTVNSDNTVTVRVGRLVEHIDASIKSKTELFDAVKYAALSKGGTLDDITLTEILFNLK